MLKLVLMLAIGCAGREEPVPGHCDNDAACESAYVCVGDNNGHNQCRKVCDVMNASTCDEPETECTHIMNRQDISVAACLEK